MPKVNHRGKTYMVHWTEEEKERLIRVGLKYKGRGRGGTISWEEALRDGALKGLPLLTLRGLSKYHAHIRLRDSRSEEYWRRRREKGREWYAAHPGKNSSRTVLFEDVPDNVRKKNGHRKRDVWTESQKCFLARLAGMKKHAKGTEIDWKKLMLHPWVRKLPRAYWNDLNALRKYYWSVVANDREDLSYKRAHRSGSLDWKIRNRERYRKNQARRVVIIRDSVNELLRSKMRRF